MNPFAAQLVENLKALNAKERDHLMRLIKEEFDNGKHYYALHGTEIVRPSDPAQLPDEDALSWHNNERYLG